MSNVKQTPNNDGTAPKDSNANTDASNKPQVNNVCVLFCCFWCFFTLPVVHKSFCLMVTEYFSLIRTISQLFAVIVFDF